MFRTNDFIEYGQMTSAFYWLRRNLETEWVLGKTGKHRVERVMYEDFVDYPKSQWDVSVRWSARI